MRKSFDRPKIMVTLGPSTSTLDEIISLKQRNVDFVRINMSHLKIDALSNYIKLAQKAQIPFIIDTEGSQVRTCDNISEIQDYQENEEVLIYENPIQSDGYNLSIRPSSVVATLEPGDILYIDFHSVIIKVIDRMNEINRTVKGIVISSGKIGSNKGIYIDSYLKRTIGLPSLNTKDIESCRIGLKNGVKYIAASFMRSSQSVQEVKKAVQNKMKIISKIECVDALNNLDDIIDESDYLLIDRGDLSKEVPLEKIPLLQKIIIQKAKKKRKGVFVATNLLESMIENKCPTRAEVHDVMQTIFDGAYGLILSAETAIGKNPLLSVNWINKLIAHSMEIQTHINVQGKTIQNKDSKYFDRYSSEQYMTSGLIKAHGSQLIDLFQPEEKETIIDSKIPIIYLNQNGLLDLEQIALGAYSPLEGFMNQNELNSVLEDYQLNDGTFWPLPIMLDIDESCADKLAVGENALLADQNDNIVGKIMVNDIFTVDKKYICKKLFGTENPDIPGVQLINSLNNLFIGGKITLFKRSLNDFNAYNLSPAQTRRLFDEKYWQNIVGFHTRNVIHRAHEFIQMKALEMVKADGLFIQPVVGQKKHGDYQAKYIIKSYEYMMKNIYPKDKVIFSILPTYSRYGGIREAVFTAICKQNYGCSHFIMGRDHTGSDQYWYENKKLKSLKDMISEIEIEIIQFDQVTYSKSHRAYKIGYEHKPNDCLSISGTECRYMLRSGIKPPEWFMRDGVAKLIFDGLKKNKDVFVND